MNIHTVTFSGASDDNDIQAMADLYMEHPYIEFGIQTPHYGTGRFPTRQWVHELVGSGIRLSAHLCQVRAFIEMADPRVAILDVQDFKFFERIQINTHGQAHVPSPAFMELLGSQLFEGTEIIFQLDQNHVNMQTWMEASQLENVEVSGLWDSSHGGGYSPDRWPLAAFNFDALYGYSGGLGPDNISYELPRIAKAADYNHEKDIWIDMENNIMTNGSLDLEKCKDVLGSVEASGYLV